MILSQEDVSQLAERIERAYRRRHPSWQSIGMTPGVWESAAFRLCEVLEESPGTPIDPELFVAVQRATDSRRDPWSELTQSRSLKRYVKAVHAIVGQLREELHEEVRRAERRMLRGMSLDRLLSAKQSRISPLSRYILAHRAGREDLSMNLRAAAEIQHRACPLYSLATESLLPADAYPMPSAEEEIEAIGSSLIAFSLN